MSEGQTRAEQVAKEIVAFVQSPTTTTEEAIKFTLDEINKHFVEKE